MAKKEEIEKRIHRKIGEITPLLEKMDQLRLKLMEAEPIMDEIKSTPPIDKKIKVAKDKSILSTPSIPKRKKKRKTEKVRHYTATEGWHYKERKKINIRSSSRKICKDRSKFNELNADSEGTQKDVRNKDKRKQAF